MADEVDRDGVHRSLLAGLLSHIGMWDDERKDYRGARETRFVVAGGTALGKRRPKWIMAGELVETDRLRARTVAPIDPDRIEQLAAHLVTRSHGEPWWDRERGAALVHERVSLYGLPIVAKRRVGYERVDPVDARAMFIRHALVEGEWDAPHAFLRENHERVVEVLALEHRVRRDLLVGEDDLAAFFDARLPADVTTGRRFDRWWKAERDRRPDLLTYTVDLLVGGADQLDGDAFPEWLRVGAVDVPLTYVSDPGAELDGVTVDVPVLLLDQVASARLDWQVPGLRHELVTALVRALPKDVRRHMPPAADASAAILREVGPEDGPLLEAVGRAVARMSGQAVSWPAGVLDHLPDHLRVTYRAVDDRDRPIALEQGPGRPAGSHGPAPTSSAGGSGSPGRGARAAVVDGRRHPPHGGGRAPRDDDHRLPRARRRG